MVDKLAKFKNVSGIYKIGFSNGYFYIGSSINIEKRLKDHLGLLKNQKHENTFLQNVFNKHKDSIYCEVIEWCGLDELLIIEQKHIDLNLRNKKLLNINPCSSKPPNHKGKIVSEETRRRLSAALTGKKKSKEHRLILSTRAKEEYASGKRKKRIGWKGLSAESLEKKKRTIEKLKEEGLYPKWNMTAEQREKQSNALKEKYKNNPETKPKPPSRLGAKVSEETKQKISNYWAKRRKENSRIIQPES